VDARQEHEQALAEVNKLCGEALDLSFDALALGQEPPAYDAVVLFGVCIPSGRRIVSSSSGVRL